MYMFMEDSITGTVCVNKTGDTTETVQILIQGGKPQFKEGGNRSRVMEFTKNNTSSISAI